MTHALHCETDVPGRDNSANNQKQGVMTGGFVGVLTWVLLILWVGVERLTAMMEGRIARIFLSELFMWPVFVFAAIQVPSNLVVEPVIMLVLAIVMVMWGVSSIIMCLFGEGTFVGRCGGAGRAFIHRIIGVLVPHGVLRTELYAGAFLLGLGANAFVFSFTMCMPSFFVFGLFIFAGWYAFTTRKLNAEAEPEVVLITPWMSEWHSSL